MERIDLKRMELGVFMGGVSEEREVSLKSGSSITASLRSRGYAVHEVVVAEEAEPHIAALVRQYRVGAAFIALHGGFGEDGRLQEMFERMRLPYTGSGPYASYCAMNKIVFKQMMLKHRLKTPAFIAINRDTFRRDIESWQVFPCVVKPHASGSSKGVQIARDKKEMEQYAGEALSSSAWAIIEEYIRGKEITVGILEERPLIPIEIIPLSSSFFDYRSKYTPGATRYQLPVSLDAETSEKVKQTALQVHRLLGCADFSRVDFIVDVSGEIYTLELNSIPGFTAQSLLPRAAAYEGICFETLCERIAVRAAYGKPSHQSTYPKVPCANWCGGEDR